ncbi:hypothetical protein VTK56DRAFT_9699 [Thermocarpiscus australiensis]
MDPEHSKISKPSHSLMAPEGSDGLTLLGDNIDDGLLVLLTNKIEAQLEELERQADKRIRFFRRICNDPLVYRPVREAAADSIENVVYEYRQKKDMLYKKLAQEHGEKQAKRVHAQLDLGNRLPSVYLEIIHETWDVVEREEGAQYETQLSNRVDDSLDDDLVVVASNA